MVSFASVSISLQLTPQMIALIIALVLVLFILIVIGGRRQQRRRRGGTARRSGAPRGSVTTRPRRRDHGLEIARKHGTARSPEWPRVAREHLMHEPGCVACGYRGQGLQVHHIKPFHLHPALELDPRNLITLCEVKGRDHHLLLGHLDEWESYNVNVRSDVKRYYGKTALHIRSDAAWLKDVAKRP
ncbi:MAG TPA: HNH endonuclease signature motif containing protein [Ktedonobacteraceae bacterium]